MNRTAINTSRKFCELWLTDLPVRDYPPGIKTEPARYETVKYEENYNPIFSEWGITPNEKIYEMISQQLKNLSEEIRAVTKHLKETLDKLDEIDTGS